MKATGLDLACSQVISTYVTEPPSMLIPSWVTSLGRDNQRELLVEPVQSIETGRPPLPPDPVRPLAPGCPVNPRFPDPGCQPEQSLLRYDSLASHKQCIPEYSPNDLEANSFNFNDSCSQEIYYSFDSASENCFDELTNSHDCSSLLGWGQSYSLSNHFDLKDS